MGTNNPCTSPNTITQHLHHDHNNHWRRFLRDHPYQQLIAAACANNQGAVAIHAMQCSTQDTCATSRRLFTKQLEYARTAPLQNRTAACAVVARHYEVMCGVERAIKERAPSRVAPTPSTDASWYAQTVAAYAATSLDVHREICKSYIAFCQATPENYNRLAPPLKAVPEHLYHREFRTVMDQQGVPKDLIGLMMEYASLRYEFPFTELAPILPNKPQYTFVALADLTGFNTKKFAITASVSFQECSFSALPDTFWPPTLGCDVLSLQGNRLQVVPAQLVAPRRVQESPINYERTVTTLNLANNPITTLSPEFCQMVANANNHGPIRLTWLDLRGCPLTPEAYRDITLACKEGNVALLVDDQPLIAKDRWCTIS